MNWNELTIGKRIGVGFGVVIVLLILLGILSFSGVGGIVNNASEVIDGKALDGVLAQREVDHLNWANAVNELISNDQIHELNVQTDPSQCEFGKWLYGEGRKQAELLVPTLIPLLKEIEGPHKALHESAIEIKAVYTRADTKLPEFIARKEVDHLNWSAVIEGGLLENLPAIKVETDPTQCGFGQWLYGEKAGKSAKMDARLGELLEKIKAPHKQLHEAAAQLIQIYRPSHPKLLMMLSEKLDDHRRWVSSVSDAIMSFKPGLSVQLDPMACGLGKWLDSDEARKLLADVPEVRAFVAQVRGPHDTLHQSARKINAALKSGAFNQAEEIFDAQTKPALKAVADLMLKNISRERELEKGREEAITYFKTQVVPRLNETRDILNEIGQRSAALLDGYHKANRIYAAQTVPSLKKVQSLLGDLRQEAASHILTDKAMLQAAQGTKRNVAIVSAIAIAAGIGLGFLIARGIVTVLNRVTDELDQGASQVSSASGQIAAASQSLAEGSSEQAASLEETSSSLEEMTSMTKRNADNAANANSLTRDSQASVNDSMTSMTELTKAMTQISKASEETSKIIKTIDEIAFQTNLLALNAAVEAARAGEAGAGFAVVADEVRNLAMRAAEAAKTTSSLIQDTSEKVSHGAGLVETTSEAFEKVRDNTVKVAGIMDEISAASQEQSQGIDQISNAISEMDKVTQQNAANAEQSASASEEMNAQAEQMKAMVDQLVKIVGASHKGANLMLSTTKKSIPHIGPRTATANPAVKEIRPEQVIPLDGPDEFKDF